MPALPRETDNTGVTPRFLPCGSLNRFPGKKAAKGGKPHNR